MANGPAAIRLRTREDAELELVPGREVELKELAPFEGPVTIRSASGEHAADFLAAGAACVAVGTESFRDPAAGRRIAAELGRRREGRAGGPTRLPAGGNPFRGHGAALFP